MHLKKGNGKIGQHKIASQIYMCEQWNGYCSSTEHDI